MNKLNRIFKTLNKWERPSFGKLIHWVIVNFHTEVLGKEEICEFSGVKSCFHIGLLNFLYRCGESPNIFGRMLLSKMTSHFWCVIWLLY